MNTKSSNPKTSTENTVLSLTSCSSSLVTYPAFNKHFPPFFVFMQCSNFFLSQRKCCLPNLISKVHPNVAFHQSIRGLTFSFLLSSPVISPPCGLRGGYAVLSHVKVHRMLIPHRHALQIFYTDNTGGKKNIHDTKRWHCDSPQTKQPGVRECMQAFVDVQREKKMWTKNKWNK